MIKILQKWPYLENYKDLEGHIFGQESQLQDGVLLAFNQR